MAVLRFALVFDREERLAEFVGRTVPYAGLPGRGLVGMLKGQAIGLALRRWIGWSTRSTTPRKRRRRA